MAWKGTFQPSKQSHAVTLECVVGDIANQPDVEAVVNAANAELRTGGGVAGAIHRAAGPGLEAECRPLAPIGAGQAVMTGAHALPNRYVIHCLGPVYGYDEPADSRSKVAGSTRIAAPDRMRTCRRGRGHQHACDARERRGVFRRHTKQEALDGPGHRKRAGEADRKAGGDRHGAPRPGFSLAAACETPRLLRVRTRLPPAS